MRRCISGGATRLAELFRRLRHPRATVRGRLTLLYGGMVLATGVALLAITYVLVGRVLPAPGSPIPGKVTGGNVVHVKSPDKPVSSGAAVKLISLQRDADLQQLLIGSSIALALMTVASVALGWLLAGRALRPLRTITSTTQQISADNLHERLALSGPRDELKVLSDTIDGLLTRLEAAFEAQQTFVANASHELRTPLTLVRAMLQVALADPGLTLDSLRSTCDEVIDAGRHQEALIDALLTLARSQRGLDHREPLDLAAITSDVVHAHESAAVDQGVHLDLSVRSAPMLGDPQLIERLVSNLVENALHHNEAGGHVQVLVDRTGDQATLTVRNTGPIVPADQVPRLLQPFQRLAPNRAAVPDGFGLGLSIVQAISSAHGANLGIRPGNGGGLEVDVSFPSASGSRRPARTIGTGRSARESAPKERDPTTRSPVQTASSPAASGRIVPDDMGTG